MWIKTRKAISGIGGKGAVRNIDSASARCLIKMRMADPSEDPAKKPKPAPKPKVEAQPETPKRTYQRRDAAPKQKVVMEAEEPAKVETEETPEDKPERED